MHDRDQHGGRGRVTDPHGQEGRDAHEPQHQPETRAKYSADSRKDKVTIINAVIAFYVITLHQSPIDLGPNYLS